MKLQYRINLLSRLGEYMLSADEQWIEAKFKASIENGWFLPEFIELAVQNIASRFLQKEVLESWSAIISEELAREKVKTVGIVMAGNIPLVGFHDFLCVFISGHKAAIKPSGRDKELIKHLVAKLVEWEPGLEDYIRFEEMLKSCDAYIATGSTNSSRYFEYYFGKYPHIIRKNRTSVAILTGKETAGDLEKLADDVYQFFGLGCRNVTKLFVPEGYDFVPLLEALKKYNYLADHHKYKNNYDYNLALHMLNRKFYMTNGSVLLVEEASVFSPISQLNYSFYDNNPALIEELTKSEEIQCITGYRYIPFGTAQCPSIADYADGVNTLNFLISL
ncbi:MAG: acyl-CoA reductase [Chitinophagaceae bacterium]|nr:acyl-CoA reductase [Chitinophagaceae bacterium]MBK8952541.1 acyl-CoA reductase [Chitinophagaceae bacterium]